MSAAPKASAGNFYEDFRAGQTLRHPVPRTLGAADNSLYIALTGDRSPLHCSQEFARKLGLPRETIHDLLVFHTVFGKSVPDISLNAVANLGYADVRFLAHVFPGDTLAATSQVIAKRETSAGATGIVWVQTTGENQHGEPVLQFCRWVMVHKREPNVAAESNDAPTLPSEVPPDRIVVPDGLDLSSFDASETGGRWFWEDYARGERIHHLDGMTIEEAEHQLATRLYQNTARVHFDAHLAKGSRFGRRLMYGGHVISVARALAYNGLENVVGTLAWNGGSHANPTFAGDTLYAWTDVLDTYALPGRTDGGVLRLRLVAVKNADPTREELPLRVTGENGRESYHPNVVLDLDHLVLVPRRPG